MSGRIDRDLIGSDLLIRGSTVIDRNRNINANSVTTKRVVIKDPTQPRNIYLFGPSTLETGALAAYYPNVIATATPIPGTNLRSIIQPQVLGFPFTFMYNTDNRHSDGLSAPDYMQLYLGMPLINAFEITKLPVDDGNIINYAVGGASALGCTWNAFPNPITFANTLGPNSIVDQVDKFVSHLTAANKTISADDFFVFASQNINDLGPISTLGLGIPAGIASSVNAILTKFQQLYNLGARHIMFQTVGVGSVLFNIIPGFIRLDQVAPGTINNLSNLSDAITNAFDVAFSAAVGPGGPMAGLDLIFTDTSTLASQISVDRGRFGIRSNLLSDPDPRYPNTFAITSSFVTDGNLLTVTATAGTIVTGMLLQGGGVSDPYITILGQQTGISGGTGIYIVSKLQLAGVAPTAVNTVPSLPFPTMIEQASVVQPIRKLDRKLFFCDDIHFTQSGHVFHAKYFTNFITPFKPVLSSSLHF